MKKKGLSRILGCVMVIALTACGQQEVTPTESGTAEPEEGYAPETVTLNIEDGGAFNSFSLTGDFLYYTCYPYEALFEYSLKENSVREIPLEMSDKNHLSDYCVDKNGYIYALLMKRESAETESDEFVSQGISVCKYDAQGKCIFEKDITGSVNLDEETFYIRHFLTDEKGNTYIFLEKEIILVDAEGKESGIVEIPGEWKGAGLDRNGAVCVCYATHSVAGSTDMLSIIDFHEKKLGETYQNVTNISGKFSRGILKDFLTQNEGKVYEYDLEKQTSRELFSWMDFDISAGFVKDIAVAPDGIVTAILCVGESDSITMMKFRKGNANEASVKSQKEEIVIGTLESSSELEETVSRFNMASDTYHVTIKQYTDYAAGIGRDEGIRNLNMDIIVGSRCPDILNLSDLNSVPQLAAKGALIDLLPYVEKSSVFTKEDFLENVLEGFTYDGKLAVIPGRFSISTLVGKTSNVGKEMGWTVAEMFTFAKEHEGAQLVAGMDRDELINYYMEFNQNSLIDWSKGECHFDSEEFRTMLTFAATLPCEVDREIYTGGIQPKEKQDDKILLEVARNIFDFYEIQKYPAIYGEEVTFIGFPAADGSAGALMEVDGLLFGITEASHHKDAAWKFVENYLSGASDNNFVWGFPVFQDKLQEKIDNIFLRDENGELILDKNGVPMLFMTKHYSFDDWEFEAHAPTEEEIQEMLRLIAVSRPSGNGYGYEILAIVSEEAVAYFEGQKSLDEVIAIIQNRMQVYVNEHL